MEEQFTARRRFFRAMLPAFLLAVSVGQIYAFTNFASEISKSLSESVSSVQFAFSLGIFFLGMGAAFFGKIVERNIKLSTLIGTVLFISGLFVTQWGICQKSLLLIYIGYGFLLGTGTGVIYISPVKTMMLWFPKNKALAAAFPIISFGLGSTLSTLLFNGISIGETTLLTGLKTHGIDRVFIWFAGIYAVMMIIASFLLKKPHPEQTAATANAAAAFSYGKLFRDTFFLRAWTFMFLNISAGLCLIPLAKQVMNTPEVGYSETLITTIVALSGILNGGGRFIFAWWSDRLATRINILLIILAISVGIMCMSFWAPVIGVALLVINACYGAGFSVIPAILADHYGMSNISKIHGTVLSAWGFAGLAGNQAALLVSDKMGFGFRGVVTMLVIVYSLNFVNAWTMRKSAKEL